MKMMMYKGELVDGETFHPPYAPKGLTLAQCRLIDSHMRNNDVAFAKAAMAALTNIDDGEKWY